MPVGKTDIATFAKAIKDKYPDYKDMNDTLLTQKILEKHPEYKDMVDMGGVGQPTPVDQGSAQTDAKVNQPIQPNGTFQPDLEGEKKGLYLNDPDYQKQKTDFVSKILTDEKGNLMYPEQDAKGNWSNYYTKESIQNFNPHAMNGKILQVPHEYLPATNGKQFITPVLNPKTGAYDFPDVQTPTVPHENELPEATVYGIKKGFPKEASYSPEVSSMVQESKKQGGQLGNILANNPELGPTIDNALKKYGPEYKTSLANGSPAMMNVIQKGIEDKYDLNSPMPTNVDPKILNGHLNILNAFDENRANFENQQKELQRQADVMQDRAKRTGIPLAQDDMDRLNQKQKQNVDNWNSYQKAVNFAQNYVNQPEVKNYLGKFQQKQQGLKVLDEVRQRSFPDDTDAAVRQDEYNRKGIEGNQNVWDYLKNFAGRAASTLSNVGETAAKYAGLPDQLAEAINQKSQDWIKDKLPQLSPEAIEEMSKGNHGMSLWLNDLSGTLGSLAPYAIPGLAEEGLGAKAATFATALASSIPETKQQALDAGLTGKALSTFTTVKPLLDAAFMTLLPSGKIAKGFEGDVAKAIENGEYNNPRSFLMNMATKAFKDPNDIAHLQAMLSGTNLGDAMVNKLTNSLQTAEDAKRGIKRSGDPVSVDLSNVFNPKQTATMAVAAKIMESVPTVMHGVSDYKTLKDVGKVYDNARNNMVELAANDLQGATKKVDDILKKDPSNIYAHHIKTTLQDFADAKSKMPDGLSPEQQTALFDIQRKVSQNERQSQTADATYKPHIEKNTEALKKQIQEIIDKPEAAIKYLQPAHDDLVNNLQSPKTDENGKTETDAQTEGQQGQIKEPGGAESTTIMGAGAAPSIQTDAKYRTLDYGNNKGKDETPEAKEKIKNEILEDKKIGGNGEKFSDLLNRVIPTFKNALDNDPHNTAIVTHSSVIKALQVWEEMGRPDISEIKGDKLKEFAQKYVDLKPESEGKVHTFTGDNGNDIKVIRHGETEDNVASEFREDNTQLTDKGKSQAERAGDNLIKETGGKVPKIISSDLDRTVHTSEIINQKLQDNALQIGQPETLGTHDNGTESTGRPGESSGMGSGQQGDEPTGESGQSGQPPEEKQENTGKEKESVGDELPFKEERGDKSILATNEGSDETISTKRSVNDVVRSRMGLPDVPIPKLGSDAEEMDKAKARVDSGKSNPLDIVDKILNTEDVNDIGLSTNDRYDMQYHMLQLKQKGLELNKAMSDVTDKLAEDPENKKAQENFISLTQQRAQHADDYIRATTANRICSSVWGKSGNAMQVELDERGVTQQRMQRISDWYGGKLPGDVKQKLDDIQKQLDDSQTKMQKLQEKYDKKVLENEALKAMKTESTKKTRKTSAEYKTERKEIVNDIKEALRKARSNLSATAVPGIQELAAITPHLLKLFKSYAAEGINKVDAVLDKMLDDLKEHVPGITKKDIQDVLAGKYKESKKPLDKTQEYSEVQQAKANAMMMLRKIEQQAMDSKKNLYMKALDFATQWERRAIFAFNNAVFVKLSSAALLGSTAHKPVEYGVGKLASKAFPKIADQAIIEGNENLQSLARFYSEEFDPKKFAQQTWQIYSKGESGLTQELSQKGHVGYTYDKKLDYLKPILDAYTNTHQVIKDPIKRAVMESSMVNSLQWYKAHGMDPSHPLIIEEARQYAYKRAEYEIFQNKNGISSTINSFISRLEESGIKEAAEPELHNKITGNLKYTVSTLYHMLVPIATVPINITQRAAVGAILPYNIIKAYNLEKGIKDIQPEQADILLKQIKKGSVGAFYWTMGLFLAGNAGGLWNRYDPDKKKSGQRDVDLKRNRAHADELKLGDLDIPKGVQHTPQLQALQYGATAANVYLHYKDEIGDNMFKSGGMSIMATLSAMIDGVPPAKETEKLLEGIGDPKQLGKVGQDLKRGFGYTKLQDAGILHPDAPKQSTHHQRQHR